MATLYSHRQFGRTVFIVAIGVAVLVGAVVPSIAGVSTNKPGPAFWVASLVPGVIACAALLLFAWMQVRVTDARLSWAFGAGFPSYTLELKDVTNVEIVKTPIIFGYGMHLTPKGWLYNVGGRQAVAVSTPARTVLIGTDDPQGLMAAIAAARAGGRTPA